MMQCTDEELDSVKRYMRVEGTDDDDVIEVLYIASKLYLSNAGINSSNNCLYKLALWGVTLYYYDHRDDVGNSSSFPDGLRLIINQLKRLPNESGVGL